MTVHALLIILMVQFGFVLNCLPSDWKREDAPTCSIVITQVPSPTPPLTRSHCENPDSGWKFEKLNGKVRSLREDKVEYDYGTHEKEVTRLVTFQPNGDYLKVDERRLFSVADYRKIPRPIFVFDKNCRVLERLDPKRSDRIADSTRTAYSYTPSGTVTGKAIYDSEERLLFKSEATLDEKGHAIETKETIQEHPEHFNPKRYDVYRHTKMLSQFDEADNLIKRIDYKYDGTLYAIYTFVYDSEHRLVRKLRQDEKARPIDLSIYKFNSSGLLLEELKYTSSTYTSINDLIAGTLDSGFGIFQEGFRITYEYDKTNNWIKKSEFDIQKGGKLDSIIYRTLIYY